MYLRILFWIIYFTSWNLVSYCYIGHNRLVDSTAFFPFLFGFSTIALICLSILDLIILKILDSSISIFTKKIIVYCTSAFFMFDLIIRITDLIILYYFGSRINENIWPYIRYIDTVPIFAKTTPGIIGIFTFIIFSYLQLLTLKKCKISEYRKSIKAIICGIILTICSFTFHYFNPSKLSYNLLAFYFTAPTEYIFTRGIYSYFLEASYLDPNKMKDFKIDPSTGIKISNSEYPIWKESIYLDSSHKASSKVVDSPNIIFLIVESFSRYFYNKDITPNLYNFAKSSYDFDQIYSATRPTLQGLFAILGSYYFIPTQTSTSMPNVKFKMNSDFYFLPRALKKANSNYTGYHAQSNYGFYGDFKYLLLRNGYDDFKGQETDEISNYSTELADPLVGIGDQGLYSYLIKKLEDSSYKSPFFLSISTADTHIPMQVSAGDYPKTNNKLLDSFRGMDFQFGKFWTFFKNSKYYSNTILVVTGDHSMFPNDQYYSLRKTQNEYKDIKFDPETFIRPPLLEKIPLLIYVPEKYKLDNVNTSVVGSSIDIAPSILDLLGYDMPNPYLGLSLFSERKYYQNLFITDYYSTPIENRKLSIEDHNKIMQFFKYLSWKNKIIPPEYLY